MKKDLIDLAMTSLEEKLEEWGEQRYRKDQIWLWLFKKGIKGIDEMTNLNKPLRDKIAAGCTVRFPKPKSEVCSQDGHTKKIVLELDDRSIIESVWMKEKDRHTVCVSTQVGCPLACRFCATGKMGFKRNLKASEMIKQLMYFRDTSIVDRIVFMGMGEPMLNLQEIEKALKVITSDYGFTISPRRITISTAGLPHGIVYIADNMPGIGVAISLNSPSEQVRRDLMPIARKYTIRELLNAARYFTRKGKRKITFEYILISGVNDSRDDARHLLDITSDIPCKINLIPYNPIPQVRLKKPNEAEIEKFRGYLLTGKPIITVRFSKGSEIFAGCGQLGSKIKIHAPSV